MKINAQEVLLSNKNMQLRETPKPADTSISAPAAKYAYTGMSALEVQGQNNLAFQGVNSAALTKSAKTLILPAALAGIMALTQSCDDDRYTPEIEHTTIINNETNISISISIKTAYDEATAYWQKMYEEQKITNEELIKNNQLLASIYDELKAGRIKEEEFYQKLYELMATSNFNQQLIYQQLIANGKTEQEAVNFLKEINDKLAKGEITAKEAYEEIMKILNSINDNVAAIYELLADNLPKLTKYMEKQDSYWNNALGGLGYLIDLAKDIKGGQAVTNEELANGFQNIIEKLDLSNDYAKLTNDQLDKVLLLMNQYSQSDAMTVDEFKEALAERDQKLAEDFMKFIEAYGFDKMPGDVLTIKNLLSSIENMVKQNTDYSQQLNIIISYEKDILDFIKTIDLSNPECVAKLENIINILNNFKCNCECGKPAEDNDESIKDLEDLFGKS